MSSPNLPKLPSLPKIRSVVACECGCGRTCGNRFAPGHDAKLLGYVRRISLGLWVKDGTIFEQIVAMAAWHAGSAIATAKAMGIDYAEAMAAVEAKVEKAG